MEEKREVGRKWENTWEKNEKSLKIKGIEDIMEKEGA